MSVRYEFLLWMLKEASNSLLFPDLEEPTTKPRIRTPQFFKPSGELVCLSGYQKHTPAIRNFAKQSPENFAQVMMFSPLSANINFADLFEGFPVLMHWLRKKGGNVTTDEIANFINGLSDFSVKKTLAKVVGRNPDQKGGAWKIKTIADIWNKRQEFYQKANSLNDKGDMVGLLSLFSSIPGVAPVKAGFITQLLFGKLGCLDTHNIDMYRALSKRMGWGLEKYLSPQAVASWIKDKNQDQGVQAYRDILKKMDEELGIGSQELWDLWTDLVGELYRKSRDKEVYSSEFGAALNPHDPKWEKIRGPLGSTFTKTTSGGVPIDLTPASGSPEGMAVSKVHQMASLDPEELISQLSSGEVGRKHLLNTVIRDKAIAPLLVQYKDILSNDKKLNKQMAHGAALTRQVQLKRRAKEIIIHRLMDRGWSARDAANVVKEFEKVTNPEDARSVDLPNPLF